MQLRNGLSLKRKKALGNEGERDVSIPYTQFSDLELHPDLLGRAAHAGFLH